MRHALDRRPVRLALLAALVVAAGVAVFAIARGGEPPARTDPHAQRLSTTEVARILRAGDAPTTASRAELEAEGRRLFRSSAIALRGESCQTCHIDGAASFPLGVIRKSAGPRDAPALWGVKDTAPYLWDGSIKTLDAMVVDTVVNHFKGGTTMSDAEVLRNTRALVAYLETLDPPQSDFDNGTLSAAARRGEEVFQGQGGCIGCHTGPLFTDNAFHPLNVPDAPGANDPGAGLKAFNTPTLRDVANTAPYMHNGQIKTLTEVVQFYNARSSIAPLDLTAQQVSDLVAYLEALSR